MDRLFYYPNFDIGGVLGSEYVSEDKLFEFEIASVSAAAPAHVPSISKCWITASRPRIRDTAERPHVATPYLRTHTKGRAHMSRTDRDCAERTWNPFMRGALSVG